MKTCRGLCLCLGWLVSATAICAQNPAAVNAKPGAARTGMFTGTDKAAWLPKGSLLPASEAIEAAAQKLSSRLRNVDPFGLPTFPREDDRKAAPDTGLRPTLRPTLNQALQTIRVTGINLEKKEFLIGGRNVFVGDVMQLSFQNEMFFAQVMEVGATQITFKDLDRQDTGVLTHSLMPRLKMEPAANRPQPNRLGEKLTPMERTPNRPKP